MPTLIYGFATKPMGAHCTSLKMLNVIVVIMDYPKLRPDYGYALTLGIVLVGLCT